MDSAQWVDGCCDPVVQEEGYGHVVYQLERTQARFIISEHPGLFHDVVFPSLMKRVISYSNGLKFDDVLAFGQTCKALNKWMRVYVEKLLKESLVLNYPDVHGTRRTKIPLIKLNDKRELALKVLIRLQSRGYLCFKNQIRIEVISKVPTLLDVGDWNVIKNCLLMVERFTRADLLKNISSDVIKAIVIQGCNNLQRNHLGWYLIKPIASMFHALGDAELLNEECIKVIVESDLRSDVSFFDSELNNILYSLAVLACLGVNKGKLFAILTEKGWIRVNKLLLAKQEFTEREKYHASKALEVLAAYPYQEFQEMYGNLIVHIADSPAI